MRRLLLCGVFAVLGCEERKRGEYSATEPTVKSSKGVTPSPSPELPVYKPAVKAEEKTEPAQPKPVDPKTAAFWAGMAKFIEESRRA